MSKPLYQRRLEFVGGVSNKFWEISVFPHTGNEVIVLVSYGKIGTRGTDHPKTFPMEYRALRYARTMVRSKLRKGYVDTFSATPDRTLVHPARETFVDSTMESARVWRWMRNFGLNFTTELVELLKVSPSCDGALRRFSLLELD